MEVDDRAGLRRSAPGRVALLCGSTGALVAATVAGLLLAYAEKLPCSSGGAWNSFTGQFRDNCYTDIYPLYFGEGLSSGKVPYTGHHVEYPVLIGGMMQLAAWIVRPVSSLAARGQDFYYVTIGMLAVCAVAGVLATAYAAGAERRWQALMVALSPGLILTAFINWDLLAMALTALGIAAWAARRPALAGVMIGLAVAAKFYPLVVIGALFLLCLRAGRMREFWRAFGAGAIAWLVVNVPVMIAAPSGWATFYVFSEKRPADWGSAWYMFEHYGVPGVGDDRLGTLNLMSTASCVIAVAAVALLTLTVARRPRLPQVSFLLLVAFLATNKVWSPQYVIWLVPLAVLARPRLWPYLLWQLGEIAYFFGIWAYFVFLYGGTTPPGGISDAWYFASVLARLLTVCLLAGYVVYDMIRPEKDVARSHGADDPAGGVLNGAEDRFSLRWLTVPRGQRARGLTSAS